MNETQINMFDAEKKALNISNMDNPALLRDIPFDKIYEAARKEASRKKPVFFVHKYFARRITCNFRMMLLGLLLPYEEDIWDYFYDSYENIDLSDLVILDPFMGGGTTLFEGNRLNAKVIGSDLQPLSKFVTKALINKMNVAAIKKEQKKLEQSVKEEIMHYYHTTCPECGQTADVMYAFHVKKVKTESSCKEHKLFSNFVLALKKDMFTLVCPECGEVFKHNFKEDGAVVCKCGYKIESPQKGFVNHGGFKCDKCGDEHIVSEYTAEEGYPLQTEIIALEYYCPHCQSHDYKKVDEQDVQLYQEACDVFDKLEKELPIPQQAIPVGYNTNQILNHGYKKFKYLFNKRQLLGLGLLLKAINNIKDESVQFWMLLSFSGMLEMNNMFCRYQANAYKICNIFFNHAYVPITMPVENNIWGSKLGTGNFVKTLDKIIRGKKFCSEVYDISTVLKNGKIAVEKKFSKEKVEVESVDNYEELEVGKPLLLCQDSSNLSCIPDKSVNVVLTDPPFGANVMYSELIDFFHTWDSLSSISSKLGFDTPLSPKDDEIIVNSTRNKTQQDYENGLTRVFAECSRVLKDNGYLIFSFHDKSIASWFSILCAINKAGFSLAKAYPLHAESRTGAHTSNKNSVALDIMLICKKRQDFSLDAFDDEMAKRIEEESFSNTEEIIKRLTAIKAEITIPDIENIFISQYFCVCTKYRLDFADISPKVQQGLSVYVSNLETYFSEYDISSRRSGWWSELYKKKWELKLRTLKTFYIP